MRGKGDEAKAHQKKKEMTKGHPYRRVERNKVMWAYIPSTPALSSLYPLCAARVVWWARPTLVACLSWWLAMVDRSGGVQKDGVETYTKRGAIYVR
jgi:hypothetical protein